MTHLKRFLKTDIKEINSLLPEQILACVAWHFRRDHFSEGSLISESIAEGHMLSLLSTYLEKAKSS